MSDKIAIVGAGIIGICTALRALEAGHQVTLIDPQEPGSGCSAGNAGHFATEQVFPLADPALLTQIPAMLLNPHGPLAIRPRYFVKVLPWLWRFIWQMVSTKRRANTKVLRTLCEAALPAWCSLLQRCDLEHHLILNGSLLVFETTPLKEIQMLQRHYQQEGVEVSLLNRQDLEKLEPELSNTVSHALFFERVGHTANPLALSQALYRKFIELGGSYLQEKVTALTLHQAQWQVNLEASQCCTQKPTSYFDTIVLCAGAHSKQLCGQLGYSVPLEAERGYHLNCVTKHLPQRPIASYERKFIMTPMSIGLRLAGTVEFAGVGAKPNPKRADGFYQHGCALWPRLVQIQDPRVEQNRWMGHRPSLPDSLPVISAAREKNLYFNFGHQHLGLTLAAISAEHVMQLVGANNSQQLDQKQDQNQEQNLDNNQSHWPGAPALSILRFHK